MSPVEWRFPILESRGRWRQRIFSESTLYLLKSRNGHADGPAQLAISGLVKEPDENQVVKRRRQPARTGIPGLLEQVHRFVESLQRDVRISGCDRIGILHETPALERRHFVCCLGLRERSNRFATCAKRRGQGRNHPSRRVGIPTSQGNPVKAFLRRYEARFLRGSSTAKIFGFLRALLQAPETADRCEHGRRWRRRL
jgi:hypothetical protein